MGIARQNCSLLEGILRSAMLKILNLENTHMGIIKKFILKSMFEEIAK